MSRRVTRSAVSRSAVTAVLSLVLLCMGASAALAGPKPIEPEFAPTGPSPAASTEQGFEVQLRWMLDGAGVLLLAAAVALVVVLWHRSHSAARRVATH